MPEFTSVADLVSELDKSSLADPTKPHLVFCSAPVDGHTNPLLRATKEMTSRGYPATFIGGADFEAKIREAGADFAPIGPMFTAESFARRLEIPVGIPRLQFDMKHMFLDHTEERWEALKSVLTRIRVAEPQRDIIVVPETCFMGHNPLLLDAPLPKGFTTRPKVVNLHSVPYIATSIDTGPTGPGLPPDSTDSGRARNLLLHQMMLAGPLAEINAYQQKILDGLGCTKQLEHNTNFHHWMTIPDATLQMCPPSLEYPRSDIPDNIRFIGCPTPNVMPADFAYPAWWDEVVTSRGDRKLVVVTQGTVARVYTDLLLPTLSALADREDLNVVAILGEKGATLPDGITIPANVQVIDYLPYDAILPHTDVFVMNAGYGGMLHGMTNGVPMVLGGASEDKPEVCMRGEYAGIAVNLRTGTPTVEAIREGVERVLADGSYRARVEEIRRENEAMGVYDLMEKEFLAAVEVSA